MSETYLPFVQPFYDSSRTADRVERWVLVLHGILGSGSNWATFARGVVAARPDWGCLLADLREHGRSVGAPPPHTVVQCAEDLIRWEQANDFEVAAVVGHSFGSKVAALYAQARERRGRPLELLWLIDGDPSAVPAREGSPRRGSVEWIIARVADLPDGFERRESFVDALVDRGVATSVAQWLGTNLRRGEDGDELRFRLDLDSIRALLQDYRRTDAWDAIESSEAAVRVVLGGKSDVVSSESRARFETLARDRAASMALFEFEEAGHWVHADAPDRLLNRFVADLGAEP